MTQEAFQIVVLGCTGGPRECNISGYLISPLKEQEWIALDAGSLLVGIEKAIEKKSFKNISFSDSQLSPAGEMLIKQIRCFLISHAHLDHIAGLVLNSQIDEKKVYSVWNLPLIIFVIIFLMEKFGQIMEMKV